jgi:hypothetical protein
MKSSVCSHLADVIEAVLSLLVTVTESEYWKQLFFAFVAGHLQLEYSLAVLRGTR